MSRLTRSADTLRARAGGPEQDHVDAIVSLRLMLVIGPTSAGPLASVSNDVALDARRPGRAGGGVRP